ncbi:hypothetical protein BGX23_010727 [Mortierella sp. AD031]|nr:hypothetical protein BGX23_010727 [Mortierella sp. AD031]
MHDSVPPPPPRDLENSMEDVQLSRWNHRPSLLFQPSFVPNIMAENSARSSTQGAVPLGSISTSTAILPPGIRTEQEYIPASTAHQHQHQRGTPNRSSGTFPSAASFHIHPPSAPHPHHQGEPTHNNPYKPPSHTNSSAFVPPRVAGYEFRGGSQAGNMGLMLGRRISDGLMVTGKLHQSLTLLQHEHRILKRLQIKDGRYSPNSQTGRPPPPPATAPATGNDAEASERCRSSFQTTPGDSPAECEPGLVEGEKYFNRIVVDFVDLDRTQMSILIMRRLGPNLLSHHHHRFTGLDETDGHQSPELHSDRMDGSPFPDIYTFLVFCLKAACVLEALQKSNLAHLALSPTAFHWSPPESFDGTQSAQGEETIQQRPQRNPSSLYHEADSCVSEQVHPHSDQGAPDSSSSFHSGSGDFGTFSQSPKWDVNDTKLRLFDFTHSKILSHERARAPNNIFEWHIPGYLEYHLQFLAPEQTGRAETWMDHRTDIYGLGATLFTLLTMQFPNRGTDSVQILQGVLSRELPPLRSFRPDMPPVIDDILRKMTKKQPSQRYQNAFGFKQDILHCLNELQRTGTVEQFPLGKHDMSYQFVLPNTVFGRHIEQQMISAAISQAAAAYQHNSDASDTSSNDGDASTPNLMAMDDDHYVFEDEIVSLQSQASAKISLSSKTLLRTPKAFDGGKAVHRGLETTDPVVRAIFVSGPSGVGKSMLIRGMAPVARNSGLFAGGSFEADESEPYSAILACIQSVLQQLLTQHTDALASLVVAIRTAFEPNSGIGIVCDLIPELKYFFNGSVMPESKDIPLTHSVARFHALILKLIRVISTHFFMTWLIDDIHYADENSIALLATLVNVNKRLPIVLIMTHRDTIDCLIKVKQILGGSNPIGNNPTGSYGTLGNIHHDPLVDEISSLNTSMSAPAPMTKTTAIRATGLPLVVRGGGGVRFIRLQNPSTDNIQEFLAALLHHTKADVAPLAKVLYQKSWLTIRQLTLELYRNQTIRFNSFTKVWEWDPCAETLAHEVRKLTGEEYAFLEQRFRALDCDTKKIIICAAVCGSIISIHDLQHLASTAYVWSARGGHNGHPPHEEINYAPKTALPDSNKGSSAMAGLQSALREGILAYTTVPDHVRFTHNIMRKVALSLLDGTDEKERLHYEMAKIMFKTPGQEFQTASHVLLAMDLIKKKFASGNDNATKEVPAWVPVVEEGTEAEYPDLDTESLRAILALAGEKSQKSGAQDLAMAHWYAALTLLPDNCWDLPSVIKENPESSDMAVDGIEQSVLETPPVKTPLYLEALKLHIQCIEAERWRENFDEAMRICNTVLDKITDPIDRARVYQHQIEISVWAFSRPEEATRIAIQCLQELGLSKEISFNPNQAEIRKLYDETHLMLLEHMEELQAENPKVCTDPRINMMMEVLSVANSSLYYCNVPFLAVGVVESLKLVCAYGFSKDAGRALVSFALTHSTWHGCLENAYEVGKLAYRVCKDNHHVKFLFHLTVQQWGEHIANSIPALEETLTASDMTCDRLFHTAGTIHISVMRVLLGRVHLRDCMTATMDLINKHNEFGPKSHGVEVMQGILQLVKCLKGQTQSENPETIFDDNDFAESKVRGKVDKSLILVHNNSTYTMLKIMAAFVFGHYEFIDEITKSWHDDPKSMMNYEGTWISHSILTVIGLALVNLLRSEQTAEVKERRRSQLLTVKARMEKGALKFPTNHASMFHLIEAEMADQEPEEKKDLKSILLLYEKSIAYAIEGDFPLHRCIAYELAAKCHLRHGLVTSARCLLANSCKGYQIWGARGKALWFYKTYPDIFGTPPEVENAVPARGFFYRPSDSPAARRPRANSATGAMPSGTSNGSNTIIGAPSHATTSPWLAGSPKTMYSPGGYGTEAVSAAAAAIAESCLSSTMQSGNASTTSSTSGPLSNSNWIALPQSPEMDNVDLDVLDFSSVIEAMQVIASEIDLDLLLVKSLGVLNQSVGAKRCCLIIAKDQEMVLAVSQGDLGRCEAVNPPMEISQCSSLFHGVINYVINTGTPCLLINAQDDPRFCADDYLKQRSDLRTVLCAPIVHKGAMVGILYMEAFPQRAFANKRMLVMNLLVQQLGISITNAMLYQSVLQSETKLNGLLENMPCGIALWDATAENCLYINSSWKDMTGFSLDEIMDSGWEILTHVDEVAIYSQHWRERVQAGVPCQWESRYRLKDGSYRWAIVRMLPIKSPSDHKIIQWLTVTIDIDDQRRAVQLKSNFLANMSHELRTPFSGILGMLSLLRDSSGLSQEQFEFVDMAKASCEMLIRIVDDLLNFSKLEADKVTLEYIPLCFEEIIGDVCDLLVPLASRKGLELIILFDPTLPLLLIGDPDRMKQILMNLIGNAIKFSTKGNVVIEFWHEMNRRESRSQESSQNLLRIISGKTPAGEWNEAADPHLGDEVILHCAVRDQGIGLSPQEQKMLFVSFQQTDNGTTRKYGGTGLGLSICAQLIAHMQGKIVVDSEKGKGATFTFTAKLRTLTPFDQEQNPAETGRLKDCEKIVEARLEVITGKRILVLSPNQDLREQVRRALTGTTVVEFESVETALKSGVIRMTGLNASGRSSISNMDLDTKEPSSGRGPSGSNSDAHQVGDIMTDGYKASLGLEGAAPFDFIVVDHVLDSAELDRIYPSPAIAFVLLLAPTTETLRWILPPAAKKQPDEPEESGALDVGGRGRIRQEGGVEMEDKPVGQVQRVSAESGNSADISNPYLAQSHTAGGASGSTLSGSAKRKLKVASELFKKRKSRGHITVTRPIPHYALQDNEQPKMETTTFQICRMIKPARRLKLLQIFYNAIQQHSHRTQHYDHQDDDGTESLDSGYRRGSTVETSTENDSDSDTGMEKKRRLSTTGTTSDSHSPPMLPLLRSRSSSPMSTTSSSGRSVSLKRRRIQDSTSDSNTDVERKRLPKARKGSNDETVGVKRGSTPTTITPKAVMMNLDVEYDPPRNLGLSGAVIGVDDKSFPKRTRNNDALTLLLTPEERNSCRGKNVLVAEDDFVSQKILEKQLTKLGMNVMIANNGQEAVNQWLSVERGHYAIAIFDHHMPIMDGLAATRKVRELEGEFAQEQNGGKEQIRIPIVGLSADIQQSTKESCIKAGMDEYMTKPLLTKGLALLIQRYCCSTPRSGTES